MNKIRRIVQVLATLICNLNIPGLFKGQIFAGKTKGMCVPGLNCYSCPAAVGSCPIGSLQSFFGNLKHKINVFVIGLIVLFGAIFGRFICGWLCPFGLLQELFYKIPFPKYEKKIGKIKYVKYFVLAVFVVLMPLVVMMNKGIGSPAFCKYVCPQGTIAGMLLAIANNKYLSMIGIRFLWKFFLLLIILIASMAIYRPFCQILCPLGAIYALFNSVAFVRININDSACNNCGMCSKSCPMHIDVKKNCNDAECVRCGKCIDACSNKAINYKCGWKEETQEVK